MSESETERKSEVPASPRDEPLFHCDKPSGVPRGTANSTVSLNSQRHPGKFPKVPGRSRGKRLFPATTRERPRKTLFNASWGPSHLPLLESHNALLLATRRETWLPWRRTRGSMILAEPHEKTPMGAAARGNPWDAPVLARWRAFFSCMAWRTIPSPLSKMKRRLDSIDATRGLQEIRVATREDSGVTIYCILLRNSGSI